MNDTQNAAGTALERSGPDQQLTVLGGDMTPDVFKARVEQEQQMRGILIDHVQRNMKEGHHYSQTLGTQKLDKPMLLQEGTRNICSLFRLHFGEPQIAETYLEGDHYRARTHIQLFNAQGIQIASGDAICSTRETKYAYRQAQRICPDCDQPTVRKDNKTDGGGWYCWKKDGVSNGCGAKFKANDERIVDQKIGRVDNPDKADVENTVLKMSVKRAKSAAVCDVPLVSEIFAPEGDDDPPKQQSVKPKGDKSKVETQQAPPPAAPKENVVENVVGLVKKLTDRGAEISDLITQFCPEGVAKFEDLSEAQALEIQPAIVELLNAKLTEK